jgi:hypothetical protein
MQSHAQMQSSVDSCQQAMQCLPCLQQHMCQRRCQQA